MIEPLAVGSDVTDFTLNDQQGNPVTLSELAANQEVLIYFYPKASTPGCTVQAEALRDHKEAFEASNVAIVGISPDPVKRIANFVEKKSLNFTLLSDEDHAIADAFGIWGEKKFMGKVYDGIHRISFLIGQDMKVKQVFTKFKTKNHHEVVLEAIS